jgi:hypothetical protein
VLDALLRLRQICCDPGLLKTAQAARVKESAQLALLLEGTRTHRGRSPHPALLAVPQHARSHRIRARQSLLPATCYLLQAITAAKQHARSSHIPALFGLLPIPQFRNITA